MGLLVPYDASPLSKAALIRATQFDTILEEGVTALTVVPRSNTSYVRERGWIAPDERYDQDKIVETLEESVRAIAPDATFEVKFVSRNAPYGTIANRIRRHAADNDVGIVFIGSENAGRMVGSLSVGSAVSSGTGYDTMIISEEVPAKIEKLEEQMPTEDLLEAGEES